LLAKGYIKIIRDTVGLEDDPDKDDLEKLKKEKNKKDKQQKDSIAKFEAVLPEKKKPVSPDSSGNDNK
jgi:hypothetical protein